MALAAVAASPVGDLRGGDLGDHADALGAGAEARMLEETANVGGGVQGRTSKHDDATVVVAEPSVKEAEITGEEGLPLPPLQVSEHLLLVLPLGPANLEADLLHSNAPAAQPCHLVAWNVVIENDHAAGRATTSRTTPRRVNRTASRTAGALTS